MAVVGWSIAGVVVWSFFDARQLAVGISDARFEAWTAAVLAGTKVAVALLPLGLSAGWIWHRSKIGARIRAAVDAYPRRAAAGALAAAVGWLIVSYAAFGLLALFRTLFASEEVHQLALAIAMPATVLGAVLLCAWSTNRLQRLLDRFDPPGQSVVFASALIIIIAVGWAFSLTILGATVWEDLSPQKYVPFAVIAVFGLTGALLADHRHPRRGVVALTFLVLPFAAASLVGEPSKALRLALVHGDTGTGFITSLTESSSHGGFAAAEANRGQSAVCDPDVEPPELSDVGRTTDESPDIIWLTIDALRWDHTTMAGYERDTTPHIADHARGAAVFERAFTPSTSTRQTFRSLFTGTYPSMIDPPRGPTWGLTIPDEQHTIAEFMSSAGYHTAAFSAEDKIFSADHGGLQGFDVIDESPVEQKLDEGYSGPRTIDLMIDELETVDGPQFLWAHLTDPHQPYRPGPDPVDFGDEPVDRYDAALHFADEQADRLLDFVAERQKERPTYLVISADHGHAFGEHGNRHHGTTVFQEETHVPLIFWGPDVVADRYETQVSVLDIFSTTFDLAGLDAPRGVCADSLGDVLRSDASPKPQPVYFEQVPDYSRPYFSVGFIEGSHKLMLEPTAEAISLFDLSLDPDESDDLASDQPELFAHHLDALKAFWRERGMSPGDYWVDD